MEIGNTDLQKFDIAHYQAGDIISCRMGGAPPAEYVIGVFSNSDFMKKVVRVSSKNITYDRWYLTSYACRLATAREIIWYRQKLDEIEREGVHKAPLIF